MQALDQLNSHQDLRHLIYADMLRSGVYNSHKADALHHAWNQWEETIFKKGILRQAGFMAEQRVANSEQASVSLLDLMESKTFNKRFDRLSSQTKVVNAPKINIHHKALEPDFVPELIQAALVTDLYRVGLKLGIPAIGLAVRRLERSFAHALKQALDDIHKLKGASEIILNRYGTSPTPSSGQLLDELISGIEKEFKNQKQVGPEFADAISQGIYQEAKNLSRR
jgi:hypothetical protein